ncbi:uncharacterized protein LOC134220520 [Armigeres subalbatus]|uniref:uncharacterized protein LOC134220520 n=1 Tax=Armigeres subalbatus TaxID=124917 RepID=UPI002ED41F78
MEVDCGSAESVISEAFYQQNFRSCPIELCKKRLFVIDGNKLDILGKIVVVARINGTELKLFLIVLRCEKDFVPLMGRTWLDLFYKGWRSVFTHSAAPSHRVNSLTGDATVEEIKNLAGRTSPFGAQAPNQSSTGFS